MNWLEILYVLASTAFFFAVNVLSQRHLVPTSSSGCFKHRWHWSNVFTSLVHSCITGVWVLAVSLFHPSIWDDLIDGYSIYSHLILMLSTGYFIYDSVDLARNNLHGKGTWQLLLHHSCAVACLVITVQSRKYLGFTSCAVWSELNTVWLHTRHLLQLYQQGPSGGGRDGWYVAVAVAVLNALTFVLFRFVAFGWMLVFVVTQRHLLSGIFFTLAFSTLLILQYLNVQLFWHTFKKDFLVGLPPRPPPPLRANKESSIKRD